MNDNLRERLRVGMGDVPPHVESYIDKANELYRKTGFGEAPWQVVPLLALMAEMNHRLNMAYDESYEGGADPSKASRVRRSGLAAVGARE